MVLRCYRVPLATFPQRRELMGMVARNKQEKAVHVAHLLHHLWHGRTDAALTYLRRDVQAKNPEPLAALVTYLEKHQAEIIDYGRRQRAGKPMGSGRMEKGGRSGHRSASEA